MCPSGWCRSAARSAGRPTAPSPISRGTPSARLDAAPRAAGGRVRRRPHPRAGGAGRRLGRPDERRRATCGHVPLLLGVGPAAQDRRADGRAPQAQPPERADRGLRGRGLDRPALLRRPLPRDPERRRRARRRGAGAAPPRARRAAADRVRRPGRRAQGPARAAARLRGAAPRGPGRADRDRLDRRGTGAAAGRRRGRDRARPRRRRRPRSARCARPTCCARRRWAASRSAWC